MPASPHVAGPFAIAGDGIVVEVSVADAGPRVVSLRAGGEEWIARGGVALLELPGTGGWTLVDAVTDPAALRLELEAREPRLALTIRLGVRDGHPAVWVEHELRNAGEAPLELAGQPLLALALDGAGGPIELAWVSPFSWDNDLNGFRTHAERLEPGHHRGLVAGPYGAMDARRRNRGEPLGPAPVATRAGIGHYLPPPEPDELLGPYRETCGWLALTRGGETLVCAWEWSGAVLADVRVGDAVELPTDVRAGEADGLPADVRAGGAVELAVGLPADGFALTLEPGAAIAAPAALLALCAGGLDDAGHALRRLAEDVYIPPRAPGGLLDVPPVVADSWGLGERIDEPGVLTMIDAAAELGAEAFTLDKGWERAVGDWHANARFPGGIRALADHAGSRGLAFGLWVAFGNADPASPVVREHPDWRAEQDGEPVTWSFGNHALCLAHAPAGAWVRAELDRIVREYGVRWLLHDFETVARCDAAHHTHPPGAGEHANVAALYAILDELRRDHPALVVENCWNGGRMMDLAMLRRHDVGIGDDWARAVPNRLAVFGMTRFLPPAWCTRYMSDEALPPRYLVRSYLLGGPWILMGDWPHWPEAMRAEAQAGVALFKRLRAQLARSRIHHLREPSTMASGWDAVQAHDERDGGSVLLAFRSYDYPRGELRAVPRGLEDAATYRVRYEDRSSAWTQTGAELMRDGVPLPGLDDHFTTEIVYLERV
ncbi:MAG TPA: alpha-galactosidase [Solirubrobacteraceae bacterium]|nr:alpha-galactosidase [Solirubrobacteraceae bacterium]